MHPSSTPWKHIFRGWRKGPLGTNGLIILFEFQGRQMAKRKGIS